MADTFKKLYQGQPGTSTAALYTVPSSTTAIIRHIRIVNNDTTSRTVTLYDGGTSASNIILPDTTIPGGEYIDIDCFIVGAAGVAVLEGKADAASQVTVTAYG